MYSLEYAIGVEAKMAKITEKIKNFIL